MGYPDSYPQRTTCKWNIITEDGTYICLSFLDFDVPSFGECDSSSVILYNGDEDIGDLEIDRFCNSRRPPDTIPSDYNRVLVVLQSGAEESGMGFIARYEQKSRLFEKNESDGKHTMNYIRNFPELLG